MDEWANGPMDHGTNEPMDKNENKKRALEHWNIQHSISINQHLMTSIALILFKRLRVTLVTSIASMD